MIPFLQTEIQKRSQSSQSRKILAILIVKAIAPWNRELLIHFTPLLLNLGMHYDSNCFYQTQSFWCHKHYWICLITGKAGKNKSILNWQIAMKTEGCDRWATRDFKPSYSFLQSCPCFFFLNRGGGDGRKFEWKGQLEWVWNDSCLLSHRFFLLLRGLANLPQSCTKGIRKSNITHFQWAERWSPTSIIWSCADRQRD